MLTYRQPFKNEWPITQKYGDTITSSFHTGIDYGCPFGTPILSSAEGAVVFAAWDNTGYGNLVIVQHTLICATLYAHLSDVSVKVGQKVRQGELLGHSGSTGNSTGPHLHFEARQTWNDYRTHFDPMLLPLKSVDDSIVYFPSKSDNELIDAEDMKPGKVIITAPSGAFVHNEDFSDKKAYSKGTKLAYSGKVCEMNGLKFCKCQMTVWVAANDGETQILKNI